jgi:L-ribulose-5-phosphate 4-epimerase
MKLLEERTRILKISQDLIAAGLIRDTQGNISILHRDQSLIAITPSAVPYAERDAEDISVIDLEGNLLEGRWKPTSEFHLHLIFYRERDDVNAVVHTHPPKATVFGVLGSDPLPVVLNEAAMVIGGAVPIAPYARPGSVELAEVTFKATGDGNTAIMAHHGLITVGQDLESACRASIAVEASADTIITARSMGFEPNSLSPEEVDILRKTYLDNYKPKKAEG